MKASREYEGVNELTIIKELGKLTTVTQGEGVLDRSLKVFFLEYNDKENNFG